MTEISPTVQTLKPVRKRRKKNFVNNADMLAEIISSKEKYLKFEGRKEYPECISNNLAKMFHIMVERFSKKSNYVGYTYNEELRGTALLNLIQKWHKFDETQYSNAFAYYSRIIDNSFKSQLKKEKRVQAIKDEILISTGKLPSHSVQIKHEIAMNEAKVEDQKQRDIASGKIEPDDETEVTTQNEET